MNPGELPATTVRVSWAHEGWLLPAILSTTAGTVDVIGFLALGGLFTAHITGNLVVVAAHYVTGRFSEIGPILAVPVFVIVLGVVTLACVTIAKAPYASRRGLLILHAALLAGCLGLAVEFGPFANAERPMAVLVGMLAVAAMATQNALVRFALPGGTLDRCDDHEHYPVDGRLGDARSQAGTARQPCQSPASSQRNLRVRRRVRGGLCSAILEVHLGFWALALPVALAVIAVCLGETQAC